MAPIVPAVTPDPQKEPYQLGDFWSLFLVLFGVLLLFIGYNADPGDTAYILFPWLTQGPACYLGGVLFLLAFYLIGRRNQRKFGRWFTNKAGGR